MESSVVPGACLCGAVRFDIQLPTLFCVHCHCSICRRAHGAGFVTWVGVAAEQFSLRAGEEQLTRYRSSAHGTRHFCRTCGSTLLFTTSAHPERVDVTLANLQGDIDRPPGLHVYFDDHAAWVDVHDGLPRLGGLSGLEPV